MDWNNFKNFVNQNSGNTKRENQTKNEENPLKTEYKKQKNTVELELETYEDPDLTANTIQKTEVEGNHN